MNGKPRSPIPHRDPVQASGWLRDQLHPSSTTGTSAQSTPIAAPVATRARAFAATPRSAIDARIAEVVAIDQLGAARRTTVAIPSAAIVIANATTLPRRLSLTSRFATIPMLLRGRARLCSRALAISCENVAWRRRRPASSTCTTGCARGSRARWCRRGGVLILAWLGVTVTEIASRFDGSSGSRSRSPSSSRSSSCSATSRRRREAVSSASTGETSSPSRRPRRASRRSGRRRACFVCFASCVSSRSPADCRRFLGSRGDAPRAARSASRLSSCSPRSRARRRSSRSSRPRTARCELSVKRSGSASTRSSRRSRRPSRRSRSAGGSCRWS